MKTRSTFGILLATTLLILSCKDDVKEKNQDNINNVEEVTIEDQPEKKVPSPEQIAQANSVMARLMATKESKSFASYVITAGLTDILMKEEGPFTVFAPTVEAFDGLDAEFKKKLPHPERLEVLSTLLKSHIVTGIYDTVLLHQSLKAGSVKLTTLAGTTLTITKKGSDIVVTHEKGGNATMGKSDIKGTNGMVHIIDKVIAVD